MIKSINSLVQRSSGNSDASGMDKDSIRLEHMAVIESKTSQTNESSGTERDENIEGKKTDEDGGAETETGSKE